MREHTSNFSTRAIDNMYKYSFFRSVCNIVQIQFFYWRRHALVQHRRSLYLFYSFLSSGLTPLSLCSAVAVAAYLKWSHWELVIYCDNGRGPIQTEFFYVYSAMQFFHCIHMFDINHLRCLFDWYQTRLNWMFKLICCVQFGRNSDVSIHLIFKI